MDAVLGTQLLATSSEGWLAAAVAAAAAAAPVLALIRRTRLGARGEGLEARDGSGKDGREAELEAEGSGAGSGRERCGDAPHAEPGVPSTCSCAFEPQQPPKVQVQVTIPTQAQAWQAAWKGCTEAAAKPRPRGKPRSRTLTLPARPPARRARCDSGGGRGEEQEEEEERAELAQPCLYLQGLEPAARRRLISSALAAVQEHVEGLPEEASCLSEEAWLEVVAALQASAAGVASLQVLQYVPDVLTQRARGALLRLSATLAAGEAAPGVGPGAALEEPGGEQGGGEDVALQPARRWGTWLMPGAAASGASQEADDGAAPAAGDCRAPLQAAALRYLRFGHGAAQQDAEGAAAGARVLRLTPAVLQDMAVAVAEAAAEAFLADMRAGRDLGRGRLRPPSTEWSPLLLPRIFNTRALERFRNQVLLQRWLEQEVLSVVAMYEDRLPLWTLAAGGKLVRTKVYLRRAEELRSLAGWRSMLSVLLEAADVVLPLALTLFRWFGRSLSFLLTRLIGRGLGLVYRGVLQSLSQPPPDEPTAKAT